MSAISYQRSAISKIHVDTIPPQAGLNADSSKKDLAYSSCLIHGEKVSQDVKKFTKIIKYDKNQKV